MNSIDTNSPVPLYHQIAQHIRKRIERGDLSVGDALEPLRDAAEKWKVNFHTVRHAYAELARDGLVEMRGPMGTRVIGNDSAALGQNRRSENAQAFITEIVGRASNEHQLSQADLVDLIVSHEQQAQPRVSILECSYHQSADLSRQIKKIWDVEVMPLCLDEQKTLPDGNVIATHFHYNEIRLRWPRRLSEITFIAISPDQSHADFIREMTDIEKQKLTVCERDKPTAEAVIADLSAMLPKGKYSIGKRVIEDVRELSENDANELFLLPPRIWGALADAQKESPQLHEIRYVLDAEELADSARKFGWATH